MNTIKPAMAVILLGNLCGCVRAPPAAYSVSTSLTPFKCRSNDDPSSRHPLAVRISGDPQRVRLTFDGNREELLDRVSDSGGQLFANQSYAWRLAPRGDVLTDVERIRTYSCVRDNGATVAR